MDEKLIILIIFIGLTLLGHILKRSKIIQYKKRINFTTEYNDKLIRLLDIIIKDNNLNYELFDWLSEFANKMQRELGNDGILYDFKDPLKNIYKDRFQVLINFLPALHEYIGDMHNNLTRNRFDQMSSWCCNMLARHRGSLRELCEKELFNIYNPFSCIGESVRRIIWLPIDILMWSGVISKRVNGKLRASLLVKMINFIIIILGFISSIMTIILGWENFVILFKR